MIVVIVAQDPVGIAIGIVELALSQHPEKRQQAKPAQKQRDGDKDDEHVHVGLPFPAYFSRSAFNDTVMELADIAKAAASGVAKPAIAMGTATTL